MRHSGCQKLSDAQVARLETRRQALGLTREKLLEKFDHGLKGTGYVYDGIAAAKMRLDRVFNRRMRRPISESTKTALAHALDWTIPQLEKAIRVKSDGLKGKKGRRQGNEISEIARDLGDVARRLEAIARKLKGLTIKRSPTR